MTPLLLLMTACADKGDDTGGLSAGFTPEQRARVVQMSPVPAPPPDLTNAVADSPAAARLGQFIFFDERFSGDGQVSCATCHDPELGFADGLPFSQAIGTTGRHAPTVLNTVHNRWMFWDGRADSHWAQALGPLEHPVEHGGSRLQFAHVVSGDEGLRGAYEAVFGALPELSDGERFPRAGAPLPEQPSHPFNQAWEGMSAADQQAINRVFSNTGKAIAAYERLLVTGTAPIDDFVLALTQGDEDGLAVLSEDARAGLELFVGDAGCHLCHSGPLLTDLEFHNIGLPDEGATEGLDVGRYEGIPAVLADPFNGVGAFSDDPTGLAETRLAYLNQTPDNYGEFKTPGLRDVALTAPFMHDGRFETLTDVVQHYNQANTEPPVGHREEIVLPLELSDAQVAQLVAFLEEGLSGPPLDSSLLSQPSSPGE